MWLNTGRVHDFADCGGNAGLDAEALLFLNRRLDAAPLDKVLRLDDREHFHRTAGLGRAPGGEL